MILEKFYFNEPGASFERELDPDFVEEAQIGELWLHPFPNTEEDSFAFGMVEAFSQSDDGSNLIAEYGDVVAYRTRYK